MSERKILQNLATEKGIPFTSEKESRVLRFADLYSEFPTMKDSTNRMIEILENKEYKKDFSKEMTDALVSLEKASDIVQLSLDNQEKYGLVDKRWVRSPESFQEALSHGRLVMELDIRLDKDNEFWISHPVGAKASFLPPYIHEMSSEEMKQKGSRMPLEKALKEFEPYKANNHRLILELKTLGDNPDNFVKIVEKLQNILKNNDLEESVAVASLSPGILLAVHEKIPRMPLILNGGIIPCISYSQTGEKAIDDIVPKDFKWRAYGLKPFGELVVSAAEKSPVRSDGHGLHTGYVFSRLPEDLVDVLRKQKKERQKFGGVVSLSSVAILANVLEAVGADNKANQMRKYYKEIVDGLGLGVMATTWGQSVGEFPGLSHLQPEKQLEVFKRDFGLDTVVYTKSPEEFAANLPAEVVDLINKK